MSTQTAVKPVNYFSCPFVTVAGATAIGEFHGEDRLALGDLGKGNIPCENRRRREVPSLELVGELSALAVLAAKLTSGESDG